MMHLKDLLVRKSTFPKITNIEKYVCLSIPSYIFSKFILQYHLFEINDANWKIIFMLSSITADNTFLGPS